MTAEKVNFELIPDAQLDDEFDGVSGRGTTVFRHEGLDGPFVEKFVKDTGPFVMRYPMWLEKQVDAAQIVNELRGKANPNYNVPKTFISNGRVREQFVDGVYADEAAMSKADLIPAVAHFINDMSELRPVYRVKNEKVPGIFVNNVSELDGVLDKVRKFNVVSEENLNFIHEVFVFLRDMPENNIFVFGHNDLHPGNMLVNPDTGQLSVIDFELAGYQPMSYMLYNRNTAKPALWDFVNKLPRVKNPGLYWRFDACVDEMYSVINRVLFKIEAAMVYDSDIARHTLTDINMICNPIVRKRFAKLKLNYLNSETNKKMPLVPMSHYERG